MSVNKNDNDKIICECGSLITNQNINISQHQKTLKHKKYLENKSSKPEEIKITENNIVDNKEMSEKVLTKNAQRVRAYRLRKKEELGEEKYKKFMRLEKAKNRTAKKAKDDVKTVE